MGAGRRVLCGVVLRQDMGWPEPKDHFLIIIVFPIIVLHILKTYGGSGGRFWSNFFFFGALRSLLAEVYFHCYLRARGIMLDICCCTAWAPPRWAPRARVSVSWWFIWQVLNHPKNHTVPTQATAKTPSTGSCLKTPDMAWVLWYFRFWPRSVQICGICIK